MMTTSANHAGIEKRFSDVVWTSIQGLDIIRRETSFWENDTFLSHERPFFSSSTSNFFLVSSLRNPWDFHASEHACKNWSVEVLAEYDISYILQNILTIYRIEQ